MNKHNNRLLRLSSRTPAITITASYSIICFLRANGTLKDIIPSLKRLDKTCFIFHHDGKLVDYKDINLYEKFKVLNPKEQLVEGLKQKLGVTYNPLESGFILEDGTLIRLGKRNNHSEALIAVRGFDKFINCQMRRMLILYLLIWHVNCLRIYIRNKQLAVQVWSHQKVTNRQWEKLNFIISLVDSTRFYFDVVTVLHKECRYFQETKNPHNCLMMRKTYEHAREELLEKGIPRHLNHI